MVDLLIDYLYNDDEAMNTCPDTQLDSFVSINRLNQMLLCSSRAHKHVKMNSCAIDFFTDRFSTHEWVLSNDTIDVQPNHIAAINIPFLQKPSQLIYNWVPMSIREAVHLTKMLCTIIESSTYCPHTETCASLSHSFARHQPINRINLLS